MGNILIVSALKREILPLIRKFTGTKPVPLSRGILNSEGFWHFLITGIGAENVRETMRVYLNHYNPDGILNIGSAGRLHAGIDVAGIYAVEKVIFEDKHQETDTRSISGSCPGASLITAEQPVLDISARNNLYEHSGGDLVDMEAYHVSLFALQHSIPFYCFKIVTDSADEHAVEDFKKNSIVLAEKLCRLIHEQVLPVLNPDQRER